MMNFPYQPEQLTAEWLTDTLRQAGVLHAVWVVSFAAKPGSTTAGRLGQNTIECPLLLSDEDRCRCFS